MRNGMIPYEQMFMDRSQERDAALLVKENSEFRQSELGRSLSGEALPFRQRLRGRVIECLSHVRGCRLSVTPRQLVRLFALS